MVLEVKYIWKRHFKSFSFQLQSKRTTEKRKLVLGSFENYVERMGWVSIQVFRIHKLSLDSSVTLVIALLIRCRIRIHLKKNPVRDHSSPSLLMCMSAWHQSWRWAHILSFTCWIKFYKLFRLLESLNHEPQTDHGRQTDVKADIVF